MLSPCLAVDGAGNVELLEVEPPGLHERLVVEPLLKEREWELDVAEKVVLTRGRATSRFDGVQHRISPFFVWKKRKEE